jgi:hypothetical protein
MEGYMWLYLYMKKKRVMTAVIVEELVYTYPVINIYRRLNNRILKMLC